MGRLVIIAYPGCNKTLDRDLGNCFSGLNSEMSFDYFKQNKFYI